MVSIRKPHIALVAVQLTWGNRLQITSLTKVLKCANLVTLRAANEADVLNLISKRNVSKFLQECKFSCQGTIEWCSITSDAPCISLLRFMCAHVGDFIGFLRYYLAPKIGGDISLSIVIFLLFIIAQFTCSQELIQDVWRYPFILSLHSLRVVSSIAAEPFTDKDLGIWKFSEMICWMIICGNRLAPLFSAALVRAMCISMGRPR